MSDEQNTFNKVLAGMGLTALGISGATSLAGMSPIPEYQDNLEPQSSCVQETVKNPFTSIIDDIGENFDPLKTPVEEWANKDKEKDERSKELDTANIADNEATSSGSGDPEPPNNDQSNQIITRPDYSLSNEVSKPDTTQQQNNSDLANQLSESQTPNESSLQPEQTENIENNI